MSNNQYPLPPKVECNQLWPSLTFPDEDDWDFGADEEPITKKINRDEITDLPPPPAVCSSEPRNNDGRSICHWCNCATEKRGLYGEYDVCPKCGK